MNIYYRSDCVGCGSDCGRRYLDAMSLSSAITDDTAATATTS